MKFLNLGIPEIIFLLLLIFLIMGPGEITETAKKLGTWIRRTTNSPLWKDIVSTSNEIRDLPNKLIREADLENEILDVKNLSTSNSMLIDELSVVRDEINGAEDH